MTHPAAINSPLWIAVQRRDPQAEGHFVYGVKTTGIYCRPTCAARRPKPDNIVFFKDKIEAEAAGYRPCKRCKPDALSPTALQSQTIAQACQLIEQSESALSLVELATAVGLSTSHFHRLFKTYVGITPKQYAIALRDQRVKTHLATDSPITAAIYDAGFNTSSRFYETVTQRLGMSASCYKQGGAGLMIKYTLAESSLGWLIVGATEVGICAIEFGETPAVLIERLQQHFPQAELTPDTTNLGNWLTQIVAAIETPGPTIDLPLAVKGTAFQRQVWQALQTIPCGETRSYTQVAAMIGQPQAARAVARACASNPVAVVVPCHRVVRSTGEISGYRWGVERKRQILAREHQTHKE